MKKTAAILFFLIAGTAFAQQQFSNDSVIVFQQQLNEEFAETESPLTAEDKKNFKALDFFAPDPAFFVIAKFIRTPNEKPFEMPTTGGRKPKYVKYAEAIFTLDKKEFRLNIYQNVQFVKREGFQDYLFLPFTDLTSGVESYGGGRYIDLKIPAGDTIVIDFNQVYNPYCAYNHNFSCPIPPQENDLDIAIKAGVKKFHD